GDSVPGTDYPRYILTRLNRAEEEKVGRWKPVSGANVRLFSLARLAAIRVTAQRDDYQFRVRHAQIVSDIDSNGLGVRYDEIGLTRRGPGQCPVQEPPVAWKPVWVAEEACIVQRGYDSGTVNTTDRA